MPESEPVTVDPESGPVEVVMWYEDLPSALRAKIAVDRALGHLDAHGDTVEFEAWRLDSVTADPGEPRAVLAALGADILVLAAHGMDVVQGRLDAAVHQWLQFARIRPVALVVSLDSGMRREMETHPVLKAWQLEADRFDTPVFLHFGEPIEIDGPVPIHQLRSRVRTLSTHFRSIRHPSGPYLVAPGRNEPPSDTTANLTSCEEHSGEITSPGAEGSGAGRSSRGL